MSTYNPGVIKHQMIGYCQSAPPEQPVFIPIHEPQEFKNINSLISSPKNPNTNIILNAAEGKCINLKEFTNDLNGKLCLYDSSILTTEDHFYSGNLYLLPVDKRKVPGDVELGKQLTLIRTFTLIRCTSGTPHLETGYFSGRKIEFYIPRDELPLAVIQAILIKTFGGKGVFSEAICPILYEDIPFNYSDQGTGEKIDSNIKGSDMKLYKVPWLQIGVDSKSNPGRALDWSKTVQGNGLSADETIFCQLLRPGNKLTAYLGSEAPDWAFLDISALIDILFP